MLLAFVLLLKITWEKGTTVRNIFKIVLARVRTNIFTPNIHLKLLWQGRYFQNNLTYLGLYGHEWFNYENDSVFKHFCDLLF